MSNTPHEATTDHEFLVAIMKQNPLSVLTVAFFTLCIMLFWLLEMISNFEVDLFVIAVFHKIAAVLRSLCQHSGRIQTCMMCGLAVCLWVLERGCNFLVGICNRVRFAFKSLGEFFDAAFIVVLNIFNFPFVYTFHLVKEVLELAKMSFKCLFWIVKMFLRMPIAFVEWTFLVFISLFVQTLSVFMAECSEQSKKLTRAFENVDTYMRTQFCAERIQELREVLERCRTIVNTFLLCIFVVMCWWSLCLVHSTIFRTTGCNIAFYVTGEIWHPDMSLRTMIRCLLIVGKFLVKHLIEYLAPTTTNTFAYLKISFQGLFESVESRLSAIAPFLQSHDGNALEVSTEVEYGDFSTYGIICYLLRMVKCLTVQCFEYVWFAASTIFGYAVSVFNAVLLSSTSQLTVGPSK